MTTLLRILAATGIIGITIAALGIVLSGGDGAFVSALLTSAATLAASVYLLKHPRRNHD